MKIFILNLLFVFGQQTFCSAQNYYEEFNKLQTTNDTTKIIALLTEWEKNKPEDPELYVAGVNFYFNASKEEHIAIEKDIADKKGFTLEDSTGKTAGYLTSEVVYNNKKLNKALEYINKGIQKFPDRLDMRFGKAHLLREISDYQNFTKEIIDAIERSTINKNKWLWMQNTPKYGEDFFLEIIQQYLKELYDTENDSLLSNIFQISTSTLKYYPKSVPILTTTAVVHMIREEYLEALSYLQKAEKINPKDVIVLMNIARCHKLLGDINKTKKYYKKALKHVNGEDKNFIREKLKKLEK